MELKPYQKVYRIMKCVNSSLIFIDAWHHAALYFILALPSMFADQNEMENMPYSIDISFSRSFCKYRLSCAYLVTIDTREKVRSLSVTFPCRKPLGRGKFTIISLEMFFYVRVIRRHRFFQKFFSLGLIQDICFMQKNICVNLYFNCAISNLCLRLYQHLQITLGLAISVLK